MRLQPLPDALRGEKWAFVQLPLGNLREMMKPVNEVRGGGGGRRRGTRQGKQGYEQHVQQQQFECICGRSGW
jgi:hypothetical protein